MTFFIFLSFLFCSVVCRGGVRAMVSDSGGEPRAGPSAGRLRILPVAFQIRLLPAFAPLDLLPQVFCDLEPDGFHRVVAGGGMNVRAGHGQMHLGVEGGRVARLPFQQHLGDANGDEAVQALELLFQPEAQAGVGIEAANS